MFFGCGETTSRAALLVFSFNNCFIRFLELGLVLLDHLKNDTPKVLQFLLFEISLPNNAGLFHQEEELGKFKNR